MRAGRHRRGTPGLLAGGLAAAATAALFCALLPVAADGQEADTAAVVPPVSVAPGYIPPRVAFSLTIGSLDLGELQGQDVSAERLDETGAVLESERLDRTLTADGWQVGVSGLLGLTPAWALRLGAMLGTGSVEAGYSGDDEWEDDVRSATGGESRDLTLYSAEGALRFRMRSGRRLQPYAEVGMAVLHLEGGGLAVAGTEGIDGTSTLAGLAALGAIIPVRGRFAARIQGTTQLFRTPADPMTAGRLLADVDTLRLTVAEPATAPFGDAAREMVRAVRLDLGFSIELGSASGR